MLISVIVAVYNIEKYIAKCITSIQNQTFTNLQIILVDDGSTDTSGKICDDFAQDDKRIHVIHRQNGGLSAARNTGMDVAKGDFIAFVDGDDWIDSTMYEVMVNQATIQQADLVACRYRCIYRHNEIDGSSGTITVFQKLNEMLIQYLKEEEAYLIQHAAWNKLYRRDLLSQERFPVGEWYEDIVFSARVISRVKCGVYVDTALYNYVCEREDSIMNAGMTKRIFTDRIPAYLKKEQFLNGLDDKEPVNLHRYYFYKRLLLFYRDLYKKENKSLRSYQKLIRQILMERKGTFQDVFSLNITSRADYWKLKIYMMSPFLFRVIMNLNDKFVLPAKLRREDKVC